jgi:hypothetical protein
MRQRILVLSAATVTLGVLGMGPVHADDHHGKSGHGGKGSVSTNWKGVKPAKGKPVFLRAKLTGDQEVPAAGQSAAGDLDGSGEALVEVKGDRVIFSLRWNGIGAPTLGHIHEGRAGTNGDVKVPLFTTAMPSTVSKAAGTVAVTDKALAQKLRTRPAGFYVNLHDAENPGGAIRGQLAPLNREVNLLGISRAPGLAALMSGGQEVPGDDPAAVGDPDGAAVTFIRPSGNAVSYSVTWVNLTPPTLGHIHKGKAGQNGAVQLPLFTTPIPANIFSVSGAIGNQNRATLAEVRKFPGDFYANIHTAEKKDGAVRGQLIGATSPSGASTPSSASSPSAGGTPTGTDQGGNTATPGAGNGGKGEDEQAHQDLVGTELHGRVQGGQR